MSIISKASGSQSLSVLVSLSPPTSSLIGVNCVHLMCQVELIAFGVTGEDCIALLEGEDGEAFRKQ